MSRCSAALGTRVSRRPVNAAMPRLVVIAAAITLLRTGTLVAQPVAGQNINMVSGTQWPGGDPFLQRQNEPSLAVSSRNPLHLLAGANDYRTVDLPVVRHGSRISRGRRLARRLQVLRWRPVLAELPPPGLSPGPVGRRARLAA